MNPFLKLLLDLFFSAGLPIWILNTQTSTLGTVPAYLLAGFLPAAWIVLDLLVITRRFNVIAAYAASVGVGNAMLTLWFVDGLLYALRDSAAMWVNTLFFSGSALWGKPVTAYFLAQIFNPDTPARRTAFDQLLREPAIWNGLRRTALVVGGATLVLGVVNTGLNLWLVTAAFGTPEFNAQVAQVNAITRIALTVPMLLAVGWAVYQAQQQVYAHLPTEPGKPQHESDFWRLMDLRAANSPEKTT